MSATPQTEAARLTPPQRRDLRRLAEGFGNTASEQNPTLRALAHHGLARWISTGFRVGRWELTEAGKARVAQEAGR